MLLWLGCAIGERTRTSGQEPQRSGGFFRARPGYRPVGQPGRQAERAAFRPWPSVAGRDALCDLASRAGRAARPRRRRPQPGRTRTASRPGGRPARPSGGGWLGAGRARGGASW